MRFNLKKEHILLLQALEPFEIDDCEYGGITSDPKRPFGNSSVEEDIAEIIGYEYETNGDDEDEEMTESDREYLRGLYEELPIALNLILKYKTFELGWYEV